MSFYSWEDGPDAGWDQWEEDCIEAFEEYCSEHNNAEPLMEYEEFREHRLKEAAEYEAQFQEDYA